MGKRSSFERIPRDFYPTPKEAIEPLLPHLSPTTRYCEPCAGDGRLISYLSSVGHECECAFDIEPRAGYVYEGDATTRWSDGDPNCYITNPPWDRKILHDVITNLSNHLPTWLLFDADWMHTKQSVLFMPRLVKVVSIGRVKWIPDSKMTGKDNCCWYLFDSARDLYQDHTIFVGRT